MLGARETLVKKLDQVEGRLKFLREESDKYTGTPGAVLGVSGRV